MTKKLTIAVDGEVYVGLHSVVGRRRISRFLNDLARAHVTTIRRSEGRSARSGLP